MRITQEHSHHLSRLLIDRLQVAELLEVCGSLDTLILAIEKTITTECSVEDRLNAEVRDMLKQYEAEFEKGRADYQKMFSMVKNKLIKERDIIL
ncbi:MAG: DUF507 family protein [Nitrospirales bacterium]|nr:DUF507 family protein [Nitrospirales bacterium]